ncbi:MAG: hydantoinase [Acidimicrobiaceae bacterium]|nr:hydantoinase [Acidimicrobiaceae bacterium]
MTTEGPLTIGIDTGGTYTDALVYARTTGDVVAKTKVRTTHGDLGGCVSAALTSVLIQASLDASAIDLVCVSTTLATNALVEGGGRPAGLVAIGLEAAITERRGLADLTQENPLLHLDGGHSSYGLEANKLDMIPLDNWLSENDGDLEAYAVVGSFSVRNPEHELKVANAIKQLTGKPTTLSHELSGQLDAAKRSVTALLNARLVPLVRDLILAVETAMTRLGIQNRLMVMRGDGSLVSAEFVKSRPIETILSGPAASAIGALGLSGMTDGVIADIGGTTTDVAVIREGRSSPQTAGAKVGGYETMVNAIRIHTEGIGGDSHVRHTPLQSNPLSIGPRRVTPLALASDERAEILEMLEEQASRSVRSDGDGIYIWLQNHNREWIPQSAADAKVYDAVTRSPKALKLEDVVTSGLERNAIDRLVSRGICGLAAFTPTDAAHVLGIDRRYDPDASELGAKILASQLDRLGVPLAETGFVLASEVRAAVADAVGNAIFSATAEHDDLNISDLDSALRASKQLDSAPLANRLLNITIGITQSLVCVGAPALLYRSELSDYLNTACSTPNNFDVANAYGAAIGLIRVSSSTTVSAPRRGLFRVHTHDPETFYDLSEAKEFAEIQAKNDLTEKMHIAGASNFTFSYNWDVKEVDVEGRQLFIEALLKAEAEGAPY